MLALILMILLLLAALAGWSHYLASVALLDPNPPRALRHRCPAGYWSGSEAPVSNFPSALTFIITTSIVPTTVVKPRRKQ